MVASRSPSPIREVTPEAVGQLIALFERAVGLYASLVNINAYHQPGVEAGKKAAATVLDIEQKVIAYLKGTSRHQAGCCDNSRKT
jgi:glucose-6-phosphate isomerase